MSINNIYLNNYEVGTICASLKEAAKKQREDGDTKEATRIRAVIKKILDRQETELQQKLARKKK